MYTRTCLTFTYNAKLDARVGNVNMSFENDSACLTFYKESLKGIVRDFVISFHEEQTDIEEVVRITSDLFEKLINSFEGTTFCARLVAKVKFIHVNALTGETEEERFYHFPSYCYEYVDDTQDFYHRHMQKIASRLDLFNKNGSNLLIKNIEHIHICLNQQLSRKVKSLV